jgi:hypothetical protein
MRAAEEANSSADPRTTPGGLVLRITPMGAFAAGALMVSALALTLAVGRHYPLHALQDNRPLNNRLKNNQLGPTGSWKTLEEVRQSTPVRYETLQVDRGMAR